MTNADIQFNSRLRNAAFEAIGVLCEQMKSSLPLDARVAAARAVLDAHLENSVGGYPDRHERRDHELPE